MNKLSRGDRARAKRAEERSGGGGGVGERGSEREGLHSPQFSRGSLRSPTIKTGLTKRLEIEPKRQAV